MHQYLEKTQMLDFEDKEIQTLIHLKKWNELDDFHKIKETYDFVRDEIQFGYNMSDTIPASMVLKEGYGQCNTKGTLFMAILRSLQIPCRLHGFTIDKRLQKGAMTGIVYQLAPRNVVHSWVEVYFNQHWYHLEGFILDRAYLTNMQHTFSQCQGSFCGYGIATDNFQNPMIDWNQNDTYIQKEGINQDFGVYDTPDEFFIQHSQALSPIKQFIYQHIGRHLMNYNVKKIRGKR